MKLSQILQPLTVVALLLLGQKATATAVTSDEVCDIMFDGDCPLPGICVDEPMLPMIDFLAAGLEDNPDFMMQFLAQTCPNEFETRGQAMFEQFQKELRDVLSRVKADVFADEQAVVEIVYAEAMTLAQVAALNIFTMHKAFKAENMPAADLAHFMNAINHLKLSKFTKERFKLDVNFTWKMHRWLAASSTQQKTEPVLRAELGNILDDYQKNITMNLERTHFLPEANNTMLFSRARAIQGMDASYLEEVDYYSELPQTNVDTSKDHKKHHRNEL